MLFMSPKTVRHMTWYHSRDAMDGVMVHPFDGETEKQFNNVHLRFSMEPQNVYLGFKMLGVIVVVYLDWLWDYNK